jgi:predicted small lipoprotein YifL
MKAPIRALRYSPLLLVVLLLALGGCGNKGDLVLPDPPEAPAKDAPAEP